MSTRRAVEVAKRILGPDHPKTADALNNLGLADYFLLCAMSKASRGSTPEHYFNSVRGESAQEKPKPATIPPVKQTLNADDGARIFKNDERSSQWPGATGIRAVEKGKPVPGWEYSAQAEGKTREGTVPGNQAPASQKKQRMSYR